MGDRGNILVRGDWVGEVYLYTHWDGSNIANILSDALDRGKGRWTDGQYLTRIIFSEMIKGDVMGETGYGISSKQCDGDVITVHVNKGTIEGPNGEIAFSQATPEAIRRIYR